jgi:hypothetical protein
MLFVVIIVGWVKRSVPQTYYIKGDGVIYECFSFVTDPFNYNPDKLPGLWQAHLHHFFIDFAIE